MKNKIIRRLKIVRGHIDKIIQMVEGDEDCFAVVHQLHATTQGLKKAQEVMLSDQLEQCLNKKTKKIDQATATKLLKIIKKFNS